MENFFKRRLSPRDQQSGETSSQRQHVEINLEDLPSDPGKRIKISAYHPNDRERVRRAYLQKGPCQPTQHKFPQKKIGNSSRRFNPSWFNEFGNWLEYSIEKDAAFCLCCYLFKPDVGKQSGGDTFVTQGFSLWNKKDKLSSHVGGPNGAHNIAWMKCQDLMNQDQHIEVAIAKQSDQLRDVYQRRLTASIACIRLLLKLGLPLRGHDESEDSDNQGKFLEILKFLAENNESVNSVVLKNAPKNHRLTAPTIQKEIVNAVALEITKCIITDLGDDLFAILVDESRDISNKEQMAVVLRYVNKRGSVVERFLGIAHVKETTSLTLKMAVEELLCKHGLSTSRIRGQGYDGASNMRGDNSSAFYVHCFAHQLQLTLVALSKKHIRVSALFNFVSSLINVVGGSCKRLDMLRERQFKNVMEALEKGEIPSGQGLNQERSLKRAADTRWSSHYATLINLILMYSAIIDVLEIMKVDALNPDHTSEAEGLLELMNRFDFAFTLHLMKNVLGFSNELSQALQRKDQDIINAMNLVNITKERLQTMRDNGWESLLHEVTLFCTKHDIDIPNMEDVFYEGKSRRGSTSKAVTIEHHYRVRIFYTVLDMQLQELNDRFSETNSQLLIYMASLSPINLFSRFDKEKLVELAKFYPHEFSSADLVKLDNELGSYIIDMRRNVEFASLKGIGDLSEKLVENGRHIVYPRVYLLLKLALILPVATATVERAFSAMKIVKTRLRNQMSDEWMNDSLVTYIEKEVFMGVDIELIIQRFQNMKSRRGQL